MVRGSRTEARRKLERKMQWEDSMNSIWPVSPKFSHEPPAKRLMVMGDHQSGISHA